MKFMGVRLFGFNGLIPEPEEKGDPNFDDQFFYDILEPNTDGAKGDFKSVAWQLRSKVTKALATEES